MAYISHISVHVGMYKLAYIFILAVILAKFLKNSQYLGLFKKKSWSSEKKNLANKQTNKKTTIEQQQNFLGKHQTCLLLLEK